MAFATKAWHNSPTADTPLSAAALQDLETRVTNIGLGGVVSKTTNGGSYNAVAGDVVLVNQASGGFSVNLPSAAQSTTVTVVAGANISPSNLVTIASGSTNILTPWNGGLASGFTIGQVGGQAQLTSDGTNWYIVGGGWSVGQTIGGGYTNIAASESRTNVAYGTLTTPDQVQGVVLPTNGLIRVWYKATWQESVSNSAKAAIFVGGNQLKISPSDTFDSASPGVQETTTGSGFASLNLSLVTAVGGLTSETASSNSNSYTGDVATGQVVGVNAAGKGGPCDIFAAAGAYTISIQFKASSGPVTASNRKLWVQALSFA